MQDVDASGKPGSGILDGNIQWFGSFDQCLKVPASHYCLVTLQGILSGNASQSILYGICVPDECNNKDVAIGFENFFKNVTHRYFPSLHVHGKVSGTGVNCYEEPPYSAGVILTILFCGLLLLLCVIGTTIEMIHESFKDCNDNPVLVTASNGAIKTIDDFNNELRNNELLEVSKHDNETTPLLEKMKKQNQSDGLNGAIPGLNELIENIKKPKENEQIALPKPEEQSGKQQSQSIVIDFFLCFSLLRNSRNIFNTDVTASTITSLDGIRVITMFWVILGHIFFVGKISGVVENMSDANHDNKQLSMMIITNAYFAVDTFLFMSGLLLAYNAFKQLKNSKKISWKWFYLHRYLRITPTLMFVILLQAKIVPLVDKSPLWFTIVNEQRCKDYWWTNLLYMNNFHPSNTFQDSCLQWTWYLAIDWQFFVITPLMIWLISRFGYKGLIGTSLFLILGSTITTALFINHYDYNPMAISFPLDRVTEDAADFFNKVYVKPYCRIQPYVIGFVFGYLMHTRIFKAKTTGWTLALLFWSLTIIVSLCLIYAPITALKNDPHIWTKFENILYACSRHLLWGILLAWVTYACEYGYGGYVKEFLSAKFWIPLSRLNYSAYLIHLILINVMFVGHRTGLHYTKHLMVYFFCASLLLSYSFAFLLGLMVEFPCANIEKMVMKRLKKTRRSS